MIDHFKTSVTSKSALIINQYIKEHPDVIKGKQKIVINGEVKPLESFTLPTKLLKYNRDNRRFKLEIEEKEKEIGRKLDSSDEGDINEIKSLLLHDATEAKKLKEDLIKIGEQVEVAVITYDGVVINGNRRMAVLEELYNEKPNAKWERLWVVRLPQSVSEADLWRIEAQLQLSKEKVADYGPINNLLMIKEGIKSGLSEKEIATAMYGWTEDQVRDDLERLSIIDSFLSFTGQVNNYGLIKKFRLSEHFINIQKSTLKPAKRAGLPAKEIKKRLEYNFLLLWSCISPNGNSSFTHYDFRKMGVILDDFEAVSALEEGFNGSTDVRKIEPSSVMDAFSIAKDVLEYKKDRDKPKKLLDKAISALRGVDTTNRLLKSDIEILKKLEEIIRISNSLIDLHKNDRN